MRPLRLAFGVLIVLAVVIWDVGLPGRHAPSSGAAGPPTPSPSVTASKLAPAPVPGVLAHQGKPEFTATFTGSKLDTSLWDTCYPWLNQSGCKNFGNVEESEWYLPSQVQVSGGLLHLVAKREPTAGTTSTGAPKQYECRSGMITSYPGLRIKYGYVQIVARIPADAGLWPALWLNPADLSWPPEIDMIESWGDGADAGSFYHPYPKRSNADRGFITPALRATGWHTFALSWTRTKMVWLMDGKVTLTVTTRIPHKKMYIIANLAAYKPVGPLNQCNGEMLIKSIQVWKS